MRAGSSLKCRSSFDDDLDWSIRLMEEQLTVGLRVLVTDCRTLVVFCWLAKNSTPQ